MYLEPTPATFTPPAGGCDCHTHVFGPFDRYPLARERSYTPPPAPVEGLITRLDRTGLDRAIIVQPSAYGTDNRRTLDAVKAYPDRLRAVVVIDGMESDAALTEMHKAGARGVRLNLISAGGPRGTTVAELLTRVASRIRPLGWHIQIYTDLDVIAENAATLHGLGVDIVLDHMAKVDAIQGASHPQFPVLRRLIDTGRFWVKLSGTYRVSQDFYGNAAVVALARALIALAPERMVWGTDWPHLANHNRTASAEPPQIDYHPIDYGRLLSLVPAWTGDEKVTTQILSRNPARLYDFPQNETSRDA
jgi:predicted TIM-barrel fold metal-dependent hydrolase